jgi:hypothetical protein
VTETMAVVCSVQARQSGKERREEEKRTVSFLQLGDIRPQVDDLLSLGCFGGDDGGFGSSDFGCESRRG